MFLRKVKDYEIIEKIGKGKYADVFEAINVPLKEKRVIKVLKPSNFFTD